MKIIRLPPKNAVCVAPDCDIMSKHDANGNPEPSPMAHHTRFLIERKCHIFDNAKYCFCDEQEK